MLAVPLDLLPDDARVRIPIACAVTAKSRSGFYKDAGRTLPPIEKLGNSRTSVIRVGELRRYLADPNGYVPPSARAPEAK